MLQQEPSSSTRCRRRRCYCYNYRRCSYNYYRSSSRIFFDVVVIFALSSFNPSTCFRRRFRPRAAPAAASAFLLVSKDDASTAFVVRRRQQVQPQPRSSPASVGRRIVMSSSSLSREALRRRRLVALGLEAPSPPAAAAGAAASTGQNRDNGGGGGGNDSSDRPHRNNKPASKANKPVIDLLDDSSDDDEEEEIAAEVVAAPPAKKQKRVPAGSASRSSGASRTDGAAAAARRHGGDGGGALRFQAATWNVWFGPPSGGNPHVEPRMKELVRLLSEREGEAASPLWFVGLQEVTAESWVPLRRELQARGFSHFVQQRNSAPYYCVLAVRQGGISPAITVQESGWRDYSSTIMGRGFCYARVGAGEGRQALVATTHLESWTGKDYDGARQRQEQLLEWQSFCQKQFREHPNLRAAIFMGDLNWDDERLRKNSKAADPPPTEVLSLPFEDMCIQQHAGATIAPSKTAPNWYTYDAKVNPMLGGSLRRRFDRVLVFGRDSGAVQGICRGVQLLGQQALPGLYFDKHNPWNGSSRSYPTAPSDHFGLCASVHLK